MDAVCNDTEHSEIGKLYSLTHEIVNDHDKVCDSFDNVNFSKDLAVTTKRYNQTESCTAIDQTLQVLKATVLNGWPELKRDCLKLIHQYWPFPDETCSRCVILAWYVGTS